MRFLFRLKVGLFLCTILSTLGFFVLPWMTYSVGQDQTVSPSAFESIRIMAEFTPNGQIDDKAIIMMLIPAAISAILLTIMMPRYSRGFWMLSLGITLLSLYPLLDYYQGCTAGVSEINGPQIGFICSCGGISASVILLTLGLVRQGHFLPNSVANTVSLIKSRQN